MVKGENVRQQQGFVDTSLFVTVCSLHIITVHSHLAPPAILSRSSQCDTELEAQLLLAACPSQVTSCRG